MTGIAVVQSDNRVTARERLRQSQYREELGLTAGVRSDGTTELGSLLRAEDWRRNFLSDEAADYAEQRPAMVQQEGGQLETTRLRTNMLSSMPMCFSIFGHLRAHQSAAATVLGALLGATIVGLESVQVGKRSIDGIECEWAPEKKDHLDDGSAFDAVAAARLIDGRRLLIAVETKYTDSFSRDPKNPDKDEKYAGLCDRFGMEPEAFTVLGGDATRQLLRNALLAESVRRGGKDGGPAFDDAVTVVLARADDAGAREAVSAVDARRGQMPTRVVFVGHDELADAAAAVDELADWAQAFRRRYVG